MAAKKKLPATQYEISKGVKDKAFGRSNKIRRDTDKIKEQTIGLYDNDYCIKYYFDNVIMPKVDDFGKELAVPVVYGSPEMWKSMQTDGFVRDKNGKIQTPLISYLRTSIMKNRDLGNKIDANYPALYHSQQVKYTSANKYDQFNIITNAQPQQSFINTIIPEYVNITYEVVIWTDFIEHMNAVVESVIYSEGSYWGEPDRFKFRTKVDDYTNTTDLMVDAERLVRTNFTLTLFGYIIPDALVKSLSKKQSNKSLSVQQLDIGINVDADESVFADNATTGVGPSTDIVNPATPAAPNPVPGGVDPLVLAYLNTNIQLEATTITPPDTAIFTGCAFLAAPSGLPATSKASFQFFINGQLVEPSAVTSFVDNGDTTCTLVIDSGELGFTLQGVGNIDEVVAIGKFDI
tara:strand:- start:1193 stop:2407 length:1215 start_codon:yes stop_codon:yes gene_type:complete